ncbi:MAG: outer membrane beta-barrel protein [Gammaproteobacteria bacterium]|nr:outer membrane beta-barrel protein [Gammaproteobacteria bacterium]
MNKARMAITVALALSSSLALADGFQFQKGFYIGANTGASFVTGQTYDELRLDNLYPSFLAGTKTIFRDEASARGYSGGAFLGWNFYADREYIYGFEISGNAYSNRAHHTTWSIGQYNGGVVLANVLNFDQSWDMRYSADLTFHPGVFISESTALYGILGASIAEISTNFKESGRHQNNEESNTLYGFVLGAGIQKQLCDRFSMFVSYQYTYYGDPSLRDHHIPIPVVPALRQVREDDFNGVHHRTLTLDTNVFKLGLLYTF